MRWPKKVEEAYWMQFLDLRIPAIYLEWLAHMKPVVEDINEKTGIFMDPAQYTPLISWFPCTIHKVEDPKLIISKGTSAVFQVGKRKFAKVTIN